MSSDEVSIDVRLINLAGALMEGPKRDDMSPEFDVNVKLEEMERGTGEATFSFALAINTKPNMEIRRERDSDGHGRKRSC